MSQQELLKKVVGFLDQAGISYMITGSIASSLQGEPRATHDVDLVVSVVLDNVPGFLRAFPQPDYYLDRIAVEQAVREKAMFNLIELSTGDKVDFWILTPDAYDRMRFSRRYAETFDGVEMQVSHPEDTILMKLRWAKLSGGSQKQWTDALRVYEVQYRELNQEYLNTWAARLEIADSLNKLRGEAQPL